MDCCHQSTMYLRRIDLEVDVIPICTWFQGRKATFSYPVISVAVGRSSVHNTGFLILKCHDHSPTPQAE